MARAKRSVRLTKAIDFKKSRNKLSTNTEKILLKSNTSSSESDCYAALQRAMYSINKLTKDLNASRRAFEFVDISRKHQIPILTLLKSIQSTSCPNPGGKHRVALQIPQIILSDKDISNEEMSSKLVRDHHGILKWALLSPEFSLANRKSALQFLCRHLQISNPKRKSLRIWSELFFGQDSAVGAGFKFDSALDFGKAMPSCLSPKPTLKLLNRFIAYNEIGYARLLASESKLQLNNALKRTLSLQDQPLCMPESVQIMFVFDNNSALFAEEALLSSPVVGLDTETKPQYVKGAKKNPVSIVQIATFDKVFIFDMLNASHICAPVVSKILQCSTIAKLGLGIRDDFIHLHTSYENASFGSAHSVVDLNDLFGHKYPEAAVKSLARLALFCTGKVLQKSQQMSDWSRRPLSKSQTHYASLDAFICLEIASTLLNCNPDAKAISDACAPFGKRWEYSISDDPGCMWVRPW